MTINTQHMLSQAQTSLLQKAQTPSKEGDDLEKKDFMNLFLTQMSHQDPVNPMDSGAMMNQLAQFGTLEQLEALNAKVEDLNANQKNIARYQSLQFLEKDVMSETEAVELMHGGSKPVYYSLDSEVNNLKVTIEDKDGIPIYTEKLGLGQPGKHRFVWDGKNDEGTLMPDGQYKIRFLATDEAGNSSEVKSYNSGRVSQVEYRDGWPWIKTQNGMMPLSQVKMINNMSRRTFGNAEPLPLVKSLYPKTLMGTEKQEKTEVGIDKVVK